MKSLLIGVLFCLPLKHLTLTSPYGYRIHPVTGRCQFHNGIDLRAVHDTVYAVFDGEAAVKYDDLLGLSVCIRNQDLTCIYGHLSALLVSGGEVSAGQPVAITGSTGRVTGEHLHFSVRYQNQYIDPLQFLNALFNQKNHE
jgi:murein DD-endopeptidase MepM/ murein hydrolase activator NlpD